jgi:hypothetical protein
VHCYLPANPTPYARVPVGAEAAGTDDVSLAIQAQLQADIGYRAYSAVDVNAGAEVEAELPRPAKRHIGQATKGVPKCNCAAILQHVVYCM